jgi:hypothetical protein
MILKKKNIKLNRKTGLKIHLNLNILKLLEILFNSNFI